MDLYFDHAIFLAPQQPLVNIPMIAGDFFGGGRPLGHRKLGKKVTLCISKHSLFIQKPIFFWYNLSAKRSKICDEAFHNMIPVMNFFSCVSSFPVESPRIGGSGDFQGTRSISLSSIAVAKPM